MSALAQEQPIDVAELTIKVGLGSPEELYYSFAEGDQIVFNFEEVKGKVLKEIEITELPSNSKFMDFKTASISDKKITVQKKGVYRFSFKNGSPKGRICKIKIQRIPATPELAAFSTDWKWKTVYDTTFTPYTEDSLIGYDSVPYIETIKELISTKQEEVLVIDRTEKVHSYLNPNPCKTYFRVLLPATVSSKYKKEKIISMAYWVGVGKESSEAYAKNVRAIGEIAKGIATLYSSPLGGLAIGAITELAVPKSGEDVSYSFVGDLENANLFKQGNSYMQYITGKGVASYGNTNRFLNNSFYVCLYNDNQTLGIDVNVKILVIKETKIFEDKEYERFKVTPQYVTLNKVKMDVKSNQVRVTVG